MPATLPAFVQAHATHPDARMALGLAAAQWQAQLQALAQAGTPLQPTLGWLYFTDHLAHEAQALLADAQARLPGVQWVGSVGVGVIASGVEYLDEPAVVVLLCNLPREQFRLFHGRAPLGAGDGFTPHSAQVHADPAVPELPALLAELCQRTQARYLFGGLASSRAATLLVAGELLEGGLAGVAFAPQVALASRVTQGCQPVGPTRRVTSARRNLVQTLDGQAALPLLLADLGVDARGPTLPAQRLAGTLVGLTDPQDQPLARGGQFGTDTRVRHLVGVDPAHQALAVGDDVAAGMQLAFCRRDMPAARRDLTRICTELRAEAEGEADAGAAGTAPRRIVGALYASCTGRGGPHFGAPHAEAQLVQRALGDVPLAGFFAAGEIAHHHLYGYTGVLTVFYGDAAVR